MDWGRGRCCRTYFKGYIWPEIPNNLNCGQLAPYSTSTSAAAAAIFSIYVHFDGSHHIDAYFQCMQLIDPIKCRHYIYPPIFFNYKQSRSAGYFPSFLTKEKPNHLVGTTIDHYHIYFSLMRTCSSFYFITQN